MFGDYVGSLLESAERYWIADNSCDDHAKNTYVLVTISDVVLRELKAV